MEQIEKDFYQTNLNVYKPGTAERFGWTSAEAQETRFIQIIKLIKLGCTYASVSPQRVSILDFGCGDGSLFFLMHRLGIGNRYFGIDAMEPAIDDAYARMKDMPIPAEFHHYDWDGYKPLPVYEKIHFAVESGAFGTTPPKRRDRILSMLLFLPRIGFCGTFLTKSREMKYVHEAIHLIEPADVLKLIDNDKYQYVLWADYFPRDFAVGAFKRKGVRFEFPEEDEEE